MSLITSTPRGLRIIGVRLLLVTTLAWCLLPSLIGAIGGLIVTPGGHALSPGAGPDWSLLFYLMFISPLISGPFWLAVGCGTAMFTRHGHYGSLIAVLTGAVAGGVVASVLNAPDFVPLGAILATFHRFTLALLRPDAF